jgi:hypothetical protein
VELDATSVPDLPREDVQALVLLGTTSDRLPPGTAPAFSASVLLSPLVRRFEGGVERALGVDRVRIEPHVSSTESMATARVTVEKELSRNLSLVVSSVAGESREDLVVLDYRGLPGERKATLTREGDGSVSVEILRDLSFGRP